MRALSSELASRYDRGSVVFCIGVMADKDYAEMLKLLVARDVVLPFGVAEIVALIVSTSAYVVYKNVLAKRKK